MLTYLALLAGAAGLVVALAYVFQRRLIYIPLDHYVPPADTVLPGCRELTLETEDGLTLGAWFLPGIGERLRGTLIVFNGNAGNRSHRAPLAAIFSEAGLSVLLFDYRGYGGNPGWPTEAGLTADARAARDGLRKIEGIDDGRLVYFGESIGGALALSLAVQDPPAALVMRSPFTSMVDVGRVHYPFLPVRSLLKDRYPSIERIGKLTCPVLVLAGERDAIVPVDQSRRLYEAAPEPKHLFVLPDSDHNDPELLIGTEITEQTLRFLEETAGLASPPELKGPD
jgi:fermentation-respiration switch protein FrsA (DUF1100 family)